MKVFEFGRIHLTRKNGFLQKKKLFYKILSNFIWFYKIKWNKEQKTTHQFLFLNYFISYLYLQL